MPREFCSYCQMYHEGHPCNGVLPSSEVAALRKRIAELEVLTAWALGELSAGRVCELLGIDILEARRRMQVARDAGLSQAGAQAVDAGDKANSGNAAE